MFVARWPVVVPPDDLGVGPRSVFPRGGGPLRSADERPSDATHIKPAEPGWLPRATRLLELGGLGAQAVGVLGDGAAG